MAPHASTRWQCANERWIRRAEAPTPSDVQTSAARAQWHGGGSANAMRGITSRAGEESGGAGADSRPARWACCFCSGSSCKCRTHPADIVRRSSRTRPGSCVAVRSTAIVGARSRGEWLCGESRSRIPPTTPNEFLLRHAISRSSRRHSCSSCSGTHSRNGACGARRCDVARLVTCNTGAS